jgi:hypothetical protein
MKRIFEFLLSGCFHEWEIENKQDILPYNPFEGIRSDVLETIDKYASNVTNRYKNPSAIQYTLRCKKCGEMKTYYEEVRYSN